MKDKTIDYALRTTWQAVARMYNEEAAKYGATMATGFALLSIDREKGSPSTTLGPKMGMEATSLTRTLKSMEERGLITRKKNPTDGRGVIIQLTKEGKENSILFRGFISSAILIKVVFSLEESISFQSLPKCLSKYLPASVRF